MPADVTRRFCVSVIRSSVVVEFPSGYRNRYPFLLKPRDQTGGVKFLLIVQERSCVPTPVLLELTFTPWEWIPLGTAFIA